MVNLEGVWAPPETAGVLGNVADERIRQDNIWGEQNHPDGTGSKSRQLRADEARKRCEAMFRMKYGTWKHILDEEVAEAFAESDEDKLREELVQVAAVAVAWVEAIDRRVDSRSSSFYESPGRTAAESD